MKSRTYTLTLSDNGKKRLETLCQEEKVSKGELIRRALNLLYYLRHIQKTGGRILIQEAERTETKELILD